MLNIPALLADIPGGQEKMQIHKLGRNSALEGVITIAFLAVSILAEV